MSIYVQNKQQRQERASGTAENNAGSGTCHTAGAEQAEKRASGAEEAREEASGTAVEKSFRKVWSEVWRVLEDAPQSIREEASDGRVKIEARIPDVVLTVSVEVRDYIEQKMDVVKPILWPYMRRNGCSRLIYKTGDDRRAD